ncbi:Com family DNA-binding transcriptional regulator [Desulfovibrio falkowii]|uniref:Com family DNA-binding transcriptional regulator n=1 Tax=Desulfovibrio falkowii TaxID=3136602 RepID=UPI0038B28F5F
MQKTNCDLDIRCPNCGRLLARGQAVCMEFKCPRCGRYLTVRATRPNLAGHRASQAETLWQLNVDNTTRRS